MGRAAASNPFSTRRTRPGAIAFHFDAGESVATLMARLQSTNWRGQIVGPHGSGKSTLLASLRKAWASHERQPLEITLHDGQRQLASNFWQQEAIGPTTQIIIDGYEQLSWIERWKLKRFCHQHGCGLLITAHRAMGLPLVYQTHIDARTVAAIVSRLTQEGAWHVTPQAAEELVLRYGGNVREILFHLYDMYESQRKHGS